MVIAEESYLATNPATPAPGEFDCTSPAAQLPFFSNPISQNHPSQARDKEIPARPACAQFTEEKSR
jgi:hypothetical protein